MKRMIFTFMLTIVSSVWMMSEAGWCMSVAKAGSAQNIRIGGTFQEESMPCEDDTLPCPACLTIALQSGGIHYLVSNDPQIVAILDTVTIGSFAIIEGNHYLEGHVDFINVTNIIFPQTDIQQLAGEWEISRETVSTPTGDGGTRWFSTHDVNYTNYVLADDLIYKVILDQSSGYAHYSDAVPYTVDRKEDGTWLLTAEDLFSSSNPVEEGIPSPATIYRLTEDEMEWMYAANGGDEGPDYYYQHLKRHTQKETKLPSLCDEWNVLSHAMSLGPEYESFNTLHFRLTSDTIINDTRYVKLEQDGIYKGAMREGTNADIYYVPNNSTHEYLLYAFNAQVGDSLKNLWYGANEIDRFIINSATVVNIESTTPRKFTIDFEWQSIYSYAAINDTSEITHTELVWLEGLGFQYGGPLNYECPFDCAGAPGMLILCAYKNGEHIYTSDFGEQYGCEYNGKEQARLPSLCDEWNILSIASPSGQANMRLSTHSNNTYLHTYKQTLTTDTIIGGVKYAKLEESGYYLGAMREGNNRDIYYIQEGSTHEYLLYAFNAQVGDTLYNMRVGYTDQHNGKRAVVREIKATYPRTFVVGYEFIRNPYYNDTIWWEYKWIEGIGLTCGPSGYLCPYNCEGVNNAYVLCAYKNGEQVYVSEDGKKYGCEYDGKEQPRLPSLCDEWNVMEKIKYPKDHMYETYKWRLTTDTLIYVTDYIETDTGPYAIHYAKIERNRQYKGALREEINGNIYFVYPGSHQECLLYAFNAQVGDTLTNTCLGNRIIVKEILPTSPRTIVLDVEYEWDEWYNNDHYETHTDYWDVVNWIEGIGYSQGTPISYAYMLGSIHELDPPAMTVCAYKNGEQVYMADSTDVFGCDYYLHDDYPADTIPGNTIPLFARDDSGSSTVDPVDPNQVVASLRGNELIIQEFMGVEITYTLRQKEPVKTPSTHRAPQSDTFRDEVTIPITESGEYLLELTNPSWGYTIFGEFDYLPQGIETVHSNSTQHKVLLNGRLYIHHGDHIYDTQGKMIK